MNRRNTLFLSLILTITILFSFSAQAATHKSDVLKKWEDYKPKYTGTDYFLEYPSAATPFKAGKLNQFYMADGFNMASFSRYLADLQPDLSLDKELEDLAQHGAVILAANNELSHFPTRPAGMDDLFFNTGAKSAGSSNIYMTTAKNPPLYESVLAYLSDEDEYNIDKVGHRRWILNPTLKKTAFGAAASGTGAFYSTMQVFDRSRQNTPDYDRVSWPNGVFPTFMFNEADPWSVSFNTAKYDKKKTSEITVKLIRDKTGQTWDFSSDDKDKKSKYFNINTEGYGVDFCVIFRPDNLGMIGEESFTVQVNGIYPVGKRATTVSYQVFFFHIDNIIKLNIGNPYMTAFGKKTEIDPGRGTYPVIKGERTYLPIRALVEAMGGTVGWNGALQEISITLKDKSIKLYVDSTKVIVNGAEQTYENAPFVANDRTYVPVRFVAENLNCEVDWEDAMQEVTLTIK